MLHIDDRATWTVITQLQGVVAVYITAGTGYGENELYIHGGVRLSLIHISRRSGDYLYVFTERWTYEKPRKMKEYIPEINGEIMAYQDIYLPDHVDHTSFLICSSIDLNAPSETTDQKAVMARGRCV